MKKSILFRNLQIYCFIAITTLSMGCNAQEKFGGLALYTVREEMEKNPEATIKSVAEAGYKYIEAAGYEDGSFYKMTPPEFKALLKKNKLSPISTHHGNVSMENADAMIKDAKAAGFKYFVVPIPLREIFHYDQENKSMGIKGGADNFAKMLNTLGKKAAAQGMELLYHNHEFEFREDEEGMILIDYLLENTDPEYVNFEMDLYWVTKAEADPLQYFEKYPGRFVLWHVKDIDDSGNFAPVGQGNIDFETILAKRKESGMKYYFVEQDNSFDLEPLEAIKISHKGLKRYGFNKIK